MKKNILILVTILSHALLYGQITKDNHSNLSEKGFFNPSTGIFDNQQNLEIHHKQESNFNLADFDCKYHKDFYTVNDIGNIQKWTLHNDTITGGEVVLSGAGSGLAHCGMSSPTFYSTSPYPPAIIYYDSLNNWVNIPTSSAVFNNGGHANDQYYMGLFGTQNRILYYFDGANLKTIDSLSLSESFAVADIAVDTLGRAWLFKGNDSFFATTLNVYDDTSLIRSYDIEFNSSGAYGAFFLNDTLYIGMAYGAHPNSIVPLIIDGNTAQLGEPIPFIYDNYYDMATCQNIEPIVSSISQLTDNQINIFPNPTNGIIHFPVDMPIIHIEIYNLNGQMIVQSQQKNSVDITGLPSGMYLAKIMTHKGNFIEKIIKQ